MYERYVVLLIDVQKYLLALVVLSGEICKTALEGFASLRPCIEEYDLFHVS